MNTPKTYKVKGMHCASCSSIIERTVKKMNGVDVSGAFENEKQLK